jgi:hypothetical protein
MNTGNGNRRRASSRKSSKLRAMALRFDRGRLVVELSDGREVSVPLDWYPSLERATARQRKQWMLLGDGQAFHWPSLDLDLSLSGVTQGLPEALPRPPALKRRRSA